MEGRPGQCVGTAKSTGRRCKLDAIPGGTVCARFHGGAAPQVRAAAERREADRQARELLGTLGIVEDPSTLPVPVVSAELQLSAAKHLAAVVWLEGQVGALTTEEVPSSPWPKLLADARKDSDRLLVELARLGIDMAALQLQRELGERLIRFVERLLTRLGHDPMDPAVREQVRLELAAIDGEAA